VTTNVAAELDPRTPVIVGVGQYSERITDPDYRGLSAVDLAARAASLALEDAGTDSVALAAAIDTVAATRQFENSSPRAVAPLGRSDNFPRSVAGRISVDPSRAVLDVSGGQSPQHLVTEMCRTIAAGDSNAALVFGSEAISTARHLAGRADTPDFTEHADGQLEDRGFGLRGLVSMHQANHGLVDAPSQYALLENARRVRLGVSAADYALKMGALFQPFTEVAAVNPHSAAPTERTAEELATPTERNRPIADPYTRFLVARDQVNQGAAVVMTSVAEARRLGVPEDRWVFLHGHADLRERDLMDREDLSRSPAAVMATRHALEVAGVTPDELTTLDLYSCFPIAVSNVIDGIGIEPNDPRRLTVTGGLPFFGGAGNNYSMHAIAETVAQCRDHAGTFGLVGANGGMLSKYSVGVYPPPSSRARTPPRSASARVEDWCVVIGMPRPRAACHSACHTPAPERSGPRAQMPREIRPGCHRSAVERSSSRSIVASAAASCG
jgi:acetyl-CoA C-acetyltransferase